ncbi:hypothetical protein BDV96DRAFT_642248 [Lophiotrema nucula]|uniref:Bacteriocin-protection, YdeI or OmpD-associated-domain-containing protein n=1 Tax=Lophiotrema nucula TaxID=690887 RepID=A0A6A5ZI08_9PLEO|nr:hypothetical protein BDV96DRAFT_642248 [Lophiotrema nucula]
MPAKPLPTDLPFHSFATAADFEAFLEQHHTTAPGIYLKLAKKTSGIPSVSKDEAVEVALCFGWIDGWGRGIDDRWYFSRWTPRRAKSIWSQKNVGTVERLAALGKMRPAGIACVEAAKADGRWEKAYAGPATITVPEDVEAALKATPAAKEAFETLNRSERYFALLRVHNGSDKTRGKRIEALVELLAEGGRPETASATSATSANKTKTAKAAKAPVGKRKAATPSATANGQQEHISGDTTIATADAPDLILEESGTASDNRASELNVGDMAQPPGLPNQHGDRDQMDDADSEHIPQNQSPQPGSLSAAKWNAEDQDSLLLETPTQSEANQSGTSVSNQYGGGPVNESSGPLPSTEQDELQTLRARVASLHERN